MKRGRGWSRRRLGPLGPAALRCGADYKYLSAVERTSSTYPLWSGLQVPIRCGADYKYLSAVERTTSTQTGTPSASNNGLGAAHDRCGICHGGPCMHAMHGDRRDAWWPRPMHGGFDLWQIDGPRSLACLVGPPQYHALRERLVNTVNTVNSSTHTFPPFHKSSMHTHPCAQRLFASG